jgi:phosphoribosylamine--glycine ligase
MTLRVLVLGGGGREHALSVALARGGHEVIVSPGNPGIARDVRCEPAPDGAVALARGLEADLVVVGPEAPLVEGVADQLNAAGIVALGPSAAGAAIEGSKVFMKDLCKAAGVKTAEYGVFTDAAEATSWLEGREGGWVVKADGLCAGKGVTVCASASEAQKEAVRMLEGAFGDASTRVVIEAFLPGVELSVLGLCDGDDALLFAPARDHKALLDGGEGPNTGGMGAIAPLTAAHGVTPALLARVKTDVMLPVLAELKKRGTPYVGILYAGLMIDGDDVQVLEFNCRFGDPEAQAVLFGTDVEIAPLVRAVAAGDGLPGDAPDLIAACRPTCTIVAASEGYPASPVKGRPITLPPEVPAHAKVFFAGVAADGEQLLTSGGRVLAATASGATLDEAIDRAYALADTIHFDGLQRRDDIGHSVRA